METKAAFVRTNSRVKLYTEPTVDLYLAIIIHPRHTET